MEEKAASQTPPHLCLEEAAGGTERAGGKEAEAIVKPFFSKKVKDKTRHNECLK